MEEVGDIIHGNLIMHFRKKKTLHYQKFKIFDIVLKISVYFKISIRVIFYFKKLYRKFINKLSKFWYVIKKFAKLSEISILDNPNLFMDIFEIIKNKGTPGIIWGCQINSSYFTYHFISLRPRMISKNAFTP